MPPKAKIQQPIDRPLSRAYLREFGGWSTAYPPGLSEPNTLRVMENCSIKEDGAIAVRPALRTAFVDDYWTNSVPIVGSFESFYLSGGSKALLFAVREMIGGVEKVGFRAAYYIPTVGRWDVYALTHPDIDFELKTDYVDLAFSGATTYVRYLQIDNKIIALSNAGESFRMFYVGAGKWAKKIEEIDEPPYSIYDRAGVVEPPNEWIAGSQSSYPRSSETPSTATLISSIDNDNVYNFGYFYTFSNELGEGPASMLFARRTQRPLEMWNVDTTNPGLSADQIVLVLPTDVYYRAFTAGATHWNLYMVTWSVQDSVPVEGVLIHQREMITGDRDTEAFFAHTGLSGALDSTRTLPTALDRTNFSTPSTAAQGLVAGDRLILVNDKVNGAVIRWSSNQQGSYTDFSASRGGGIKTLTSGNLYIPAAVKLWQNPQSVDTLTIMCVGTDGYSKSFYMAPATVAGLSQSTTIMGFEETTATPGTVSPYGCEVLNNALYHPLNWELMKSTASNYNISHKSMTDLIENKWAALKNKEMIVSSQLDNRLYYLVNNPDGETLEDNCNGNEIWVCNTELENVWSRWLIQGVSLRKLEIEGTLYMAVIRPDGIFFLDDKEVFDRLLVDGVATEVPIPWKFETNTQGANRAHDAWAYLQQVSVLFGNFQGSVRYGIRGLDDNGKWVERAKVYQDLREVDLSARPMPYDIEDFLQVKRNLKEWRLFAESVPDEYSYGQINLVQYRYTPVSVNVGYEYGSVETFEYTRDTVNWGNSHSTNGVPQPYIDTRYP